MRGEIRRYREKEMPGEIKEETGRERDRYKG